MSKIYSVAGLFDTPDSIIKAAKKISEEGYTNFDVNTPYPIHGMDGAMKLKQSKASYMTITFGLTGTALMLFFMWWVFNVDYPQVIGGKPFFPLPVFIPILFEFTVLMGAVGSVIGLLVGFFKFPNISHPLHDTNYMKSVSSDKYGIYVEASDPQFEESKIKELFSSLGSSQIDSIYFEEETVNYSPKIFDRKYVMLLVAIAIITSASVYLHVNKLLYMDPFNFMMEQPKYSAQEELTQSTKGFLDNLEGRTTNSPTGKASMREPVKGTIARGFIPYAYHAKPEEAAVNLSNPLQSDEKTLEIGKARFLTFCSPCHGNFATGESRLHGQFPNGPTLHSAKITGWNDAQIFHVITDGQNVMPSYARQLTSDERWAVVLYVRALQRAFNAKEGDLK